MKALLLALALCACAAPAEAPVQERFLSQEQDDEIRARCAETGCAIVPIPVWRQILERLQQRGA